MNVKLRKMFLILSVIVVFLKSSCLAEKDNTKYLHRIYEVNLNEENNLKMD